MTRLAVILLLLAGCGNVRCPYGRPAAANDNVILSRNLAHGAPLWRFEAQRQVPGRPVLLIVHGATFNGRWECYPDEGPPMPVESAVRLLKVVFPGRPVLVLSCNKGGLPLNVPDTWYARRVVFSVPHVFAPWQVFDPTAVGFIEQFEHNP